MNIKKIIYYVLLITSILIFSNSLYNYYSYNSVDKSELDYIENNKELVSEEIEEPKKDNYLSMFSTNIDFKSVREEYNNNEIIARLEIPNIMNVLVTKTKDNKYYLNHSINKKYDKKGTSFMDYRVDIYSKQINIYGHNSRKKDTAFKRLEKFKDKDFFDNNEYILLQHDNGIKIYRVFFIKEINNNYEHMNVNLNNDEYINHINELLNDSIHKRDLFYDENTKILILQTCSYSNNKRFLILGAIEIDNNVVNMSNN